MLLMSCMLLASELLLLGLEPEPEPEPGPGATLLSCSAETLREPTGRTWDNVLDTRLALGGLRLPLIMAILD